MPLRRLSTAFVCLLTAGGLLAGCGGSDSDSTTSGSVESRPAPPKSDFPSADGRTLREIVKSAERAELVVSPAASAFYKGENRFPFGVFSLDRTQISDADVALYMAKTPNVDLTGGAQGADGTPSKGAAARAQDEALDSPAVGPFPASVESLATQPAFRARTTSDDPDAASAVYVSNLDFSSPGEWRIAALVKQDGKLSATLVGSAVVGEFEQIPRVGEKAPIIHTPTPDDVGGDLSKLTTRIPPDTQNRVDYADAYGKEPIVLLFATPQFCVSRVCGPVVDVAEQVKETYGGKAAFIHMEIFEDNDPNKDPRPQVRAFHLATEPWLYVIDRDGTIRNSTEGAFGVDLLTEALDELPQ